MHVEGGKSCSVEQIALWRSGTLCDVNVRVEEQTFQLHKFVLAGASGYFRALLTSGMRDAGGDLQLSETTASCFEAVVQWLYCGECELSDESKLPLLLETASFLQIPELVTAASSELVSRISSDEVATIWDLGDRFSVDCLIGAAQGEALAEFEGFAASEGFLRLDADRLGKVLADDALSAPETVVFEAVVRWLSQTRLSAGATEEDVAQLDEVARSLFSHVRFAQLPLEFVEQHVEKEPLLVDRPWGGWVLARAFRDVVYRKDTPLARKRRIRGSPVEWGDLRVGMRVRMLDDEPAILAMFTTGARAPGATKSIGLGTLHAHLAPLLGKTHVIQELLDEKRGVRIADGGARWMLPYTAFVVAQ